MRWQDIPRAAFGLVWMAGAIIVWGVESAARKALAPALAARRLLA